MTGFNPLVRVGMKNKWVFNDDFAAMLIDSKGEQFAVFIDLEDFPRVSCHKWWVRKKRRTYYAFGEAWVNRKRVTFRLHRFIMGCDDPLIEVDHKNHNGLDNRKGNLRLATTEQNRCNCKPYSNNKSGFKGVFWEQGRERWAAYITSKRKRRHLGRFLTRDDAAKAYDAAAKELHGDFARLNLPPDAAPAPKLEPGASLPSIRGCA
jgi:hypothetical protein